jgi:hypothetical protein
MSGPNAEYEITPYIVQSIGKKDQNDNSISQLFQAKYNIRKVTDKRGGNVVGTGVPIRHRLFQSR